MKIWAAILLACWGLWVPVMSASAQGWQITSAPFTNWASLACSADGRILVAGTSPSSGGGSLYISKDSGSNWVPAILSAPKNFACVAASADGTKLFASLFSTNLFYRSVDSGTTWTSNNAPENFRRFVASGDGNKLAAVGSLIYTSTDGGLSWSTNNVPSTNWGSIATSADGSRLAAVQLFGSPVYLSQNGGSFWMATNLPQGRFGAVASSADGMRLIATGSTQIPGPTYTSVDAGSSWQSNTLAKSAWGLVASSADGSSLAVTASSIFTSTNGGGGWSGGTTIDSHSIVSVAMSADGARTAVATGTGSGLAGNIYIYGTASSPRLTIIPSASNLKLGWTVPSTNFVLQAKSGLNSTNWLALTNSPTLNPSNLQNEALLSTPTNSGFYRLIASP